MKSPCSRRKYGTVIFNVHKTGIDVITSSYNVRVSSVCNNRCIRDSLNIEPLSNSELGAEIHSEQGALIKSGLSSGPRQQLFLAGITSDGKEIFNPRPCYTCLRMIVFAGYKCIHTFDGQEYTSKSVASYMEEYDFIHAPDA